MNEKNNSTSRRTKIWYIVFSIIASIALWMYISYVENPETKTTITKIPIEFTGEDILLDNDLTVTDINISELNVTFIGRWSTLGKLSNDDMTAVVDLSEIVYKYGAKPGSYMLSYDLNYGDNVSSDNIDIYSQNYNSVTVEVEKLISVPVPVKGSFDGEIAEGYTADPLIFSTEYITVSGPQAIVSQISYAWVSLTRDNLSKSVSEEIEVTLMSVENKEISSEGLILSQNTVTVTLNVLMEKEVPLTINLAAGNSADDKNSLITIKPNTVRLSGDPEVLSGINKIVLGTVDLTKFTVSWSDTYPILLPDGVNNLTGETTADVTVEVTGLSTGRLSVTNIQTKNLTDGYYASIITQSLDVTVRGEESVIENIDSENILIIADLTDYGNTTGTFTVPAKGYIVGDGLSKVDVIGEYTVTVQLTTISS